MNRNPRVIMHGSMEPWQCVREALPHPLRCGDGDWRLVPSTCEPMVAIVHDQLAHVERGEALLESVAVLKDSPCKQS